MNIPLSEDDLDTILTIARNGQSGRVTKAEIEALVAAYRALYPTLFVPDVPGVSHLDRNL